MEELAISLIQLILSLHVHLNQQNYFNKIKNTQEYNHTFF